MDCTSGKASRHRRSDRHVSGKGLIRMVFADPAFVFAKQAIHLSWLPQANWRQKGKLTYSGVSIILRPFSVSVTRP
jgi:hypothetical protein